MYTNLTVSIYTKNILAVAMVTGVVNVFPLAVVYKSVSSVQFPGYLTFFNLPRPATATATATTTATA